MEKNLLSQTWWNPFTAIATNGRGYELDNIIIYNESGVLADTGCGWFRELHNNNNTFKEGSKIEDIHLRKTIDFTKKENFLIKDTDRTYETRYILYIYYKTVNFKALEIKNDSFWISSIYQVELPEKTITCDDVLGKSAMKSDALKYEYYKMIEDLDKIKYHDIDELKKAIKKLNKKVNDFEKMKIKEKEDIQKNILEFIYPDNIDLYNNFKNMLKSEVK